MKDATLGGYLSEHQRPPAFEGPNGDSYTVEIVIDRPDEDAGPWCGYLFFLRWKGSEPVGHVESDFLSEAQTEIEARTPLERLTLHEVKDVLYELVAR